MTREDAVSKASVFEILGNLMSIPYDFDRQITEKDVSESMDEIRALPFVQSKQIECEDAISRADAIRVASGYCHPSNIAKELAKLPPVQPKPTECEDAISRQAAIDALGEKPLDWTDGEYELGLQNQWKYDVDAIKALSPVTPKTGHWIEIAQYSDGKHKIECSECKSYIVDRGHANSFNVKNKYKYCPHCGCRMVEPRESEE